MKRWCTVCHFWTDHTGRRHRAKERRVKKENCMSKECFRATSWLHFWELAGRPKWRACGFGLKYGDGMMAQDLPL